MIAHGTPAELAEWTYNALSRRKYGVPFVLVLVSKDSCALVDSESMKGKRIERENAAGIVGYYKGAQPRRPQVSVIDIQADIEETVKGLEGMA